MTAFAVRALMKYGSIEDATRIGLHLAHRIQVPIAFDFNGVPVECYPDDTSSMVVNRYYDLLDDPNRKREVSLE